MIIKYFRNQIVEITNDLSLRILGFSLSLIHLHTWWNIFINKDGQILKETTEKIICWGFFENCESTRLWIIQYFDAISFLYGLISIVAAVLFLQRRSIAFGYVGLIVLTLYKLAIYFQDFMFMGNYHYMPFWLSFVYLFFPQKSLLCRYTVVTFYLAAGLLKTNLEWFSGWAIPDSWINPNSPVAWLKNNGLLPISCVYVYLLETILSFGLLSKSKWIFWLTFLQFCLFHIMSYWIVGSYYPITMFLILFFIPIHFFQSQKNHVALINKTSLAVLFLFFVMQSVPLLNKGDTSLTGEGRAFALNMFDSLTVCDSKAIVSFSYKKYEVSTLPSDIYTLVRKQCDPFVYFQKAQKFCPHLKLKIGFQKISLYLNSRRTSDAMFQQILSIDNVCDPSLEYSHFGFNDWIIK